MPLLIHGLVSKTRRRRLSSTRGLQTLACERTAGLLLPLQGGFYQGYRMILQGSGSHLLPQDGRAGLLGTFLALDVGFNLQAFEPAGVERRKAQCTDLIIRRHEIEQLIAEAMKHACSDCPKRGFLKHCLRFQSFHPPCGEDALVKCPSLVFYLALFWNLKS